MQDGFGQTSGKGLRMVMVHRVTNSGLWVTYDESVWASSKSREGQGEAGDKFVQPQ